jgi:hypothetical protein
MLSASRLRTLKMLKLNKNISQNRQTILKGFIGTDGQTDHELILKFGNKA